MILSDLSIREALEHKKIVIDPEPEDIQIQPASIDLRLGGEWSYYAPTRLSPWFNAEGLITKEHGYHTSNLGEILVGPEEDVPTHMRHKTGEEFILASHGFVLGSTIERIEMPADIVGRVEGRSSLGRLGLMVHITAGYIDPGFKGRITLEFFNASSRPIILRKGKRICQISFETMTCAARKPYGKKKGSKYQNQEGAVPSRIHKDV